MKMTLNCEIIHQSRNIKHDHVCSPIIYQLSMFVSKPLSAYIVVSIDCSYFHGH